LSQEELAERAALHWTYVSQLERGKRNISVDALARLGTELGTVGSNLMREAERALESLPTHQDGEL